MCCIIIPFPPSSIIICSIWINNSLLTDPANKPFPEFTHGGMAFSGKFGAIQSWRCRFDHHSIAGTTHEDSHDQKAPDGLVVVDVVYHAWSVHFDDDDDDTFGSLLERVGWRRNCDNWLYESKKMTEREQAKTEVGVCEWVRFLYEFTDTHDNDDAAGGIIHLKKHSTPWLRWQRPGPQGSTRQRVWQAWLGLSLSLFSHFSGCIPIH